MDQITWLEPWQSVDEGSRFVQELQRELCPVHPLNGQTVVIVGRKRDRDDFLFRVESQPPRYAVVHLTWRVETDPEFPWTQFYETVAEFQERMYRDHQFWQDSGNRP